MRITPAFWLWLLPALAFGAREPVLPPIDLPHPYYYREMYLPQLTAGPSSLAWSPDGAELIYSMAGRLWRQRAGGGPAQQLPGGAGYDYQPDWSPDGRSVVFSFYDGRSIELWTLDLASGARRPLTANGAVNVEPRWSPDGRRIAFVSTLFHRRFHLFVTDVPAAGPAVPQRLTGETRSDLPRYYYSPYDHEISPLWSRDGREITFVSNRGHLYGTGGIWRMAAAPGAPARELHTEETNWRARPDLSPDGTRLVWSSYQGRQWHNLWTMPAGGGDAFALAYGDWDQTNARWSPDGRQIAFISNHGGSTGIEIIEVPGGLVRTLDAGERLHADAMAQLQLTLTDGQGRPQAARVSVTDAAGLSHAPRDAWLCADDGIDRPRQRFEEHYFHAKGTAIVEVPAGRVEIAILRGFGRAPERRTVDLAAGETRTLGVDLGAGRWSVPAAGTWVSGDVHVHMNYGGTYRNTPQHLALQAEAEDLGVVHALIVNKEQRFPDIAWSGAGIDPVSGPAATIVHGQEFHTSYWGHLGLLDIGGGVILPGYAAYPQTAASSPYPMNADVADMAHARGALVGYVHPFDEVPEPIAKPQEPLSSELPVDVALGKVDYLEILGFSDHRATAAVWYRLLNLGFHLPAAAGTDAMANFASLRGPVGMNRVYVRVPDAAWTLEDWLGGLKAGHSLATNGPLLGLELGGRQSGDTLRLDDGRHAVAFHATLRSIVPVDHLDLVCNGRVQRALAAGKPLDHADLRGVVTLPQSGWCVLRAASDAAELPVLDNYVYATTSPVYVSVGGAAPRSPGDARYFAAWVDRVAATTAAYPDWNDAAEKARVMARLAAAKAVFLSLE